MPERLAGTQASHLAPPTAIIPHLPSAGYVTTIARARVPSPPVRISRKKQDGSLRRYHTHLHCILKYIPSPACLPYDSLIQPSCSIPEAPPATARLDLPPSLPQPRLPSSASRPPRRSSRTCRRFDLLPRRPAGAFPRYAYACHTLLIAPHLAKKHKNTKKKKLSEFRPNQRLLPRAI